MSHRSFITPFCAPLAASSLTGCEPGSGGIGTAGGSTFLVSTSSTSTLDSFVLVDLFPDGVYAQQRVEASWTRETDDGMARPSWRFAYSVTYDRAHDRLILFGGIDEDLTTLFGDTWSFANGRWNLEATEGPSPRAFSRMWFGRDGRVHLQGGSDNGGDVVHHDEWALDDDGWQQLSTECGP